MQGDWCCLPSLQQHRISLLPTCPGQPTAPMEIHTTGTKLAPGAAVWGMQRRCRTFNEESCILSKSAAISNVGRDELRDDSALLASREDTHEPS